MAFVLGVLAVVFYNPLAASARTQAEELFAEAFGKESNFLKTKNAGSWLRQDGADGSSVMNAGGVADGGLRLLTLTVFQFDKEGRFVERVEAERATLREGYWELEKALVAGAGREPERYERYLISTYLTPERGAGRARQHHFAVVLELPGLIEVAERAGCRLRPTVSSTNCSCHGLCS